MMGVSAQISLYPLGVNRLGPPIERAVAALRARGLDPETGTMSTLVFGDDETVFDALRAAFAAAADGDQSVVLVVTVSNACPLPEPPAGGGAAP